MLPDFRDEPAELNAAVAELVAARNALSGIEGVGKPADRAKPLRRYWAAVGVVLHSSIHAMAHRKPINVEVVTLLGTLMNDALYLSTGQIPDTMKDAAGGSARRGMGPTELSHIRAAVSYRQAVTKGLISDSSPTKTVANMFGVTESTAKGWFRDYQPLSSRKSDTAQSISERAKRAGDFYREAGRASAAVTKRARRG